VLPFAGMPTRSLLLASAALLLATVTACKDGGSGAPRDAAVDAVIPTDAPATEDAPDGDPDRPDIPTCDVGSACNPDRGCPRSSMCIDEQTTANPVEGHPEGAATVTTTSWQDGYCSDVGTVGSGGCDPDAADACGDCGTCLRAGTDSTGAQVTLCAQICEPSLDDNPCRDGYVCDLGSAACLPGCTSDDECALYLTDTDGDGEDEYVYDTAGAWTCNTTTARCEHEPPADAEAGTTCTLGSECELHGRCIDEASFDVWTGGYCLKFGCDVAGNECAGDGVCDTRAFGSAVCLAPCEVGATDPADDPYAGARDCRGGYACTWNGVDSGADNGVCVPGSYNDVRAANTGASCDPAGDAAECHSPWGQGQCRDWDGDGGAGGGYCTVFDCAAPGIDSEIACGAGNVCAGVADSATSLCLQVCDSAEDCTDGYGCWDTSMAGITTGGETVCFAGCLDDAHCRSGETCVGATATSAGECG